MHYLIPTCELEKELAYPGKLIEHRTMIGVSGGVFGVHFVRPADEDGNRSFEPVGRLLGADPLGHLYVGWSDDFVGIAAEMTGAVKPRKDGVAPFTSAYHVNGAIREHMPWDRLAVSFLFREDPPNAYGTYIAQYAVRFGEFPPLNDFGPGRP